MHSPAILIQDFKWLRRIATLLALLILVCYARVHLATISEPWPLTVRESANIINALAHAQPDAASAYSWESIPEYANLYGPLYPLIERQSPLS